MERKTPAGTKEFETLPGREQGKDSPAWENPERGKSPALFVIFVILVIFDNGFFPIVVSVHFFRLRFFAFEEVQEGICKFECMFQYVLILVRQLHELLAFEQRLGELDGTD
jgi:hypothetical protein